MAREEKGKEKEKEKKKRDREKEEGKSGEMGPGSRTVGQRKESQQMQNSSSSASSVSGDVCVRGDSGVWRHHPPVYVLTPCD